jgi:hypothetical protein
VGGVVASRQSASSPICLVDDRAGDATALKCLLYCIGVALLVAFGFVLRIDCLAVGGIGRQLLGNQGEGRAGAEV